MKLTKMHGLGNDYLYVYSSEEPKNPEELSIKLSERHFGAGSDGMIWILPSKIADFKMRIFNADGSEAMMCGNGIRCVGKYVYDKGYTDKTEIRVDMCKAVVGKKNKIEVLGETVEYVPVSMGNPHAVVFVENADNAPLTTTGTAMEKHEAFPGGVNVEFVSVINKNKIRMRVWERGSGITMACGTGACASVSAAVSLGFCPAGEDVEVVLDGGSLFISVSSDYSVTMTGPAAMIYEGETIDD